MVTTKLIVVVALALAAAASAKPFTGKDLAAILKGAMKEEQPLLKNGNKHRMSLIRNHQNAPEKVPQPAVADPTETDFEKDISDMVLSLSKGDLAATPGMEGAVQQISTLIATEMMPKVMNASILDQEELDRLYEAVIACNDTKKEELVVANTHKTMYGLNSTQHKDCRKSEEAALALNVQCHDEWRTLRSEMKQKCDAFANKEVEYTDIEENTAIMQVSTNEEAGDYVARVTSTLCGEPLDCDLCVNGVENYKTTADRAWHGLLDDLLVHKTACLDARDAEATKKTLCHSLDYIYHTNKSTCDTMQDVVDSEACQWAVKTKEACEKYETCHNADWNIYYSFKETVETQEVDRKAEWHGLARMKCIIDAFATPVDAPQITELEIQQCKDPALYNLTEVTTTHLDIIYPVDLNLLDCQVNETYPRTSEWTLREFDPLPTTAKGKDPAECAGMTEISTDPNPESNPAGCECERVTLAGPFSPGPIVRCTGCTAVHRSAEINSCPENTKLFAPRSHEDWETFLASADPKRVRAPNFIIDITRPEDGCEPNCAVAAEGNNSATPSPFPMNTETMQTEVSDTQLAQRFVTQDGAHWWLRSSAYTAPTEHYLANCYMDVGGTPYGAVDDQGEWLKPGNADSITFHHDGCNYFSTAYYCQPKDTSLKPKAGSPTSCVCQVVPIASGSVYSAEQLIKCENCLDVYKSTQKNSCPPGTKIFSPRSAADWTTFLASADGQDVRNPHWIIDITRPAAGCGGCKNHSMNSATPSQATWHTTDASAWWLRAAAYDQPDGTDYEANCYMEIVNDPSTADDIQFDDNACHVHSRSYFCQSMVAAKCDTVYVDSMCPSGKMLDAALAATKDCTGNPCVDDDANDALCCLPMATCSAYMPSNCPSGGLVSEAETIECTDHECSDTDAHDAQCCLPKAKCDTYSASNCPSGELIGGAFAIECTDYACADSDAHDALCCTERACSAHTCAAGSILKTDATTVPHGDDAESTCCEVLAQCSTYACPSDTSVVDTATCASGTCSSADESTCCEAHALCSTYADCPSGTSSVGTATCAATVCSSADESTCCQVETTTTSTAASTAACRPCTADDAGCSHPGNANQAWCDSRCTDGVNDAHLCPATHCFCG